MPPRAGRAEPGAGSGGRGRRTRPAGPHNAGSGASAAPQLTERETEVLKLVATGMSYKDILHRTVQNHVQNNHGKLQMHNRVELVRYALSKGLHRD
jgi:DNA-binding NarL/FixJ family response regulator